MRIFSLSKYLLLSSAVFVLAESLSGITARLLSDEDHHLYVGTVPVNESLVKTPFNVKFIHIPKTGGSSFQFDSQALMKKSDTLKGNNEISIIDTIRLNKFAMESMALFIRQPAIHVYSQFLTCKYSPWGLRVTRDTNFPRGNMTMPPSGFTEWLAYFHAIKTSINPTKAINYDLFQCYSPWNMQTSYLSLSDVRSNMLRLPSLDVALRNLHAVGFVGITDFYRESACLFKYHCTGLLSHACACAESSKAGAFVSTFNVHSVPRHSIKDLSHNDRLMIDDMTSFDRELFHSAVALFYLKVQEVHNRTGVDVLCGNHEAIKRLLRKEEKYS